MSRRARSIIWSMTTECKSFWEWFASSVPETYLEVTEDAQFLQTLRRRLNQLGVPSWELIPPQEADPRATLVLLGSGDPQSQRVSAELAAAAPRLPGWCFLNWKPGKLWAKVLDWPGQVE
jgi:hypothetical protein